ncbi:hypothetical protein P280DRAFT_516773 [Massarina eburnea CBS 473.64]|uniref:Cell wall protein n=1 Tax=Massarina eburnea CBS 473.64 TaxID=1395130 RepID=A0A6A6S3P6_9PLEO|nr:hypothetical protein P280DRAFT_516773 [Massarina eburnea CBS 473.64]
MRYSTFALCIAAVSALPQAPGLVYKVILPLDYSSLFSPGNGITSLGDTLVSSAQQTSVHANAIYNASGQFTVDAPPSGTNVAPAIQLAQVFASANSLLWTTATELEKKVCAIASSINEQNINGQKANLVAGINAQANAILKLKSSLDDTIAKIKSLVASFTAEEKAIFIATIGALAKSAEASVMPVARLIQGLQTAGVSGLAGSSSALQASASALSQTATNVQFD